jgi:hypothetical protein
MANKKAKKKAMTRQSAIESPCESPSKIATESELRVSSYITSVFYSLIMNASKLLNRACKVIALQSS